ncbi:MAG: DNA mismatch repair endonuclease MutL [Chloroflexota bacterium]
MPIRILPDEVAAKIAAGEVVERPASVVKELLENSLDAGATEIRVEIREGGKRLIRVADNGAGIPSDEVALAFARHATSKITGVDDLSRIRTLGFRGEALASIAAVAQVTLLSRTADEPVGTQVRLTDGRITHREGRGAPVGAIITVENLFASVPVRLKFLRTDATERRHIDALITCYALAYPEQRFSLTHDGRLTFQTTGSGHLPDVLTRVYGLEVARQMLEVTPLPAAGNDIADQVSVYGYVGAPSLHRAGRDQMILFVNGRWIQDRMLGHALQQAYHTLLPVGRSPVAVLKIELDPALVDVNVHPAKSEIKFREPNAVFQAVQRAVRRALADQAPIPQVGGWASTGQDGRWERRQALVSVGRQSAQLALDVQRTSPTEEATEAGPLGFEAPRRLPPLRVLGQVAQMYIIAEGPEGLYLLDQHAAHERVLYEQTMAQKAAAQVTSQSLLEPLILELPPDLVTVLEAHHDLLVELGFQVEPFGGQAFLLRAVPAMLLQGIRADREPRQALIGVLEEAVAGRQPLQRETEERIIASVCKQAAVKAGQTLSLDEMRELVRQLEATAMPRTCPHGRPTTIHLSRLQLEREFGRR